jgi:transcriptional regulator with XRE-family HTH domain
VQAGIKLKQLREQCGLTLREVESRGRRLAKRKLNQDFFISRGWLNNIENAAHKLSFFKLYALGDLRVHWSNILGFFGCNRSPITGQHSLFLSSATHRYRSAALRRFFPLRGAIRAYPVRRR